ncbi:hypothetical protein Btru_059740 [Bulinus truncatus]|nr:hypothetical protein Btru_059740 [Bulinus truncatus]
MFGDFSKDCLQIIQSFPGSCYTPLPFRVCCSSCLSFFAPVEGCEYGDRVRGCNSSVCNSSNMTAIQECCGKCSYGSTYTTAATTTAQTVTTTKRTTASTAAPSCHDDPQFTMNGLSCSALIWNFTDACYNLTVLASCCSTCSTANTGVLGCEFGDRVKDKCFTNADCKLYKPDCCESCRGVSCQDEPAYRVDNMSCSALVKSSNNVCYDKAVRFSCCASCFMVNTGVYGELTPRRSNKADCPFGDRVKGKCQTLNDCETYSFDCCQSCRGHVYGQRPYRFSKATAAVKYYANGHRPCLWPKAISMTKCKFIFQDMTTAPSCLDDPEFQVNEQICSTVVRHSENICYNSTVQASCCASCTTANTGVLGCEFGDRVKGKCTTAEDCELYSSDCCDSCKGLSGAASLDLSRPLFALLIVYLHMRRSLQFSNVSADIYINKLPMKNMPQYNHENLSTFMHAVIQKIKSQRSVFIALVMISLCARQCESLKVILNTVRLGEMSKEYMPKQVTVQMTSEDNSTVELNLRRTSQFDTELPVVYLNLDDDGQFVTSTELTPSCRNVAFYKCVQNEAAFQISRHWNKTSEKHDFNLKGHFRLARSKYLLNTNNDHSRGNEVEADDIEEVVLTRPEDMPAHLTSLEGREFDVFLEKPKRMSTYNLHFAGLTSHPGGIQKRNGSQSRGGQVPKGSSPRAATGTSRERRAAGKNYYIDVVIYIDYSLYHRLQEEYEEQITQNIYQEFAFIFNEIDMLYDGLDTPFRLNIILSKIIIAQSAKSSITERWASDDELYADKSINALQEFIQLRGPSILGKHDHCMLFTNYDLYGLEKGEKVFDVMGVANRGTMCRTDGNSISVIEFSFGYNLISTATHELGHSLGADHDGQENDCSFEDRYIMAATNSDETNETMTNPWYFSPCTHDYITEYIDQILSVMEGVECLNVSLPRMPGLPDVGDRLLGLELSPDQQCQRIHGAGSFFCRIINASEICGNLWCSDPSEIKQCFNQKAYTGTICGVYKMCVFGECIDDLESGYNVAEDCVFGDSPGTMLSNQTCPDAVEGNPMYCYKKETRQWCCDSCRKRYRPIPDCEYGDKARGCHSDLCAIHRNLCCETCTRAVLNEKSHGIKVLVQSVDQFTEGAKDLAYSSNPITEGANQTRRGTTDFSTGEITTEVADVVTSSLGSETTVVATDLQDSAKASALNSPKTIVGSCNELTSIQWTLVRCLLIAISLCTF